jgi:aldehyde dehydrogenase (NAD+)
MITRDTMYIGGDWLSPLSTQTTSVISPSTEETVAVVPDGSPADIDRAVALARTTFDQSEWRWLPHEERISIVERIGEELTARWPSIATDITTSIGTPISVARAMGGGSAGIFRAMASVARDFAFEEQRAGFAKDAKIINEPVGVVGAISPWNGPVYLMATKLAPALVAGCTIVIKPAPEAPLDAYALAEACEAAGVPQGVVSIVPGGLAAGQRLVEHPDVDMIAFTGSDVAGRTIMASCAATLKRLELELGGKSAAIVLDDADIATAIPQLVPGTMLVTGQACALLSRVLVPANRHDEIVDALCSGIESLPLGDPFDEGTVLGPLVSERQRDRVEGYIALGKNEGAKAVIGGGRPAHLDKGWYVEPTVFTGVRNDMRVAREEIFGPVVCVIPYESEDDAVAIANDSPYGLAGAVFSGDTDRAEGVLRRVRTGVCTVNGFGLDPGIPFGGFKCSGIGREGAAEGLRAYLETKVVFNTPAAPISH